MKSVEMAPTVASSSCFFQKNPLFAKVMTGVSQANKSAEISRNHKLCRLVAPESEKTRQVRNYNTGSTEVQLNLSDLKNMEFHLLDFSNLRAEFRSIRTLFTRDENFMRLHRVAIPDP